MGYKRRGASALRAEVKALICLEFCRSGRARGRLRGDARAPGIAVCFHGLPRINRRKAKRLG